MRDEGIEATQPAISRIKTTYGDDGLGEDWRKAKRSRFIPWELLPEHRDYHVPKMLRYYTRRMDGEEVAPKDSRQLDRWLARLQAADAVVVYDPDPGMVKFEGYPFFYLPRKPGEVGPVRAP
ncbi:hypothetical protein [Segeticoccus rhizosphaerae]|uniref:hypothetical protein n=1 Tax=Segeticoccus rhizosphaerae TaxID=1104777 RepID=UPI001264D021|nr:hypothetical protein [Segeticoccus rhizosphaerae]